MEKLNGRMFLTYILLLTVVLGAVSVMKGGFFADQHEGDMLHLIDIVMRMAGGQVPHLDFMTPLGSLAFLPFSTLVANGFGIGAALVWGQLAFAVLVLPMLWWVSHSRLNTVQAYILGTTGVVVSLAFIYGSTDAFISMSMHYNRWAWVLAFVAVPIAVFKPKIEVTLIDGIILGFAMSFFAFGKITYAVALAPGLIIALAMTQQWRALLVGIFVVALVAGILTLQSGPELWLAYFRDLQLVNGTDIRPRAGETWFSLLFSPKFILGHTVLIGTVVYFRQGDDANLGAMLAVLTPGFVFITYQNFGNDPKWLIILAILALGNLQNNIRLGLGAAALLLIAPSLVNMAFSPFRHAISPTSGFVAAFKDAPHTDFYTLKTRDRRIQVGQGMVFESQEFAALNALASRPENAKIGDTEFPPCLLQLGLLTSLRSVAADLDAAGYANSSIFTADTFGSFWLFGDMSPPKNAAPWYYGALAGFDEADFVLVPICAVTPRAVKSVIRDIEKAGVTLREVRKTELYVLYGKIR